VVEKTMAVKAKVENRFFSTIWRFCRDKPIGAAGGFFFLLMLIVAGVAPWIVPYDPFSTDILHRLVSPSWEHLCGTDSLGRDVFSRIIYGAQVSALVGIGSTLLGSTMGMIIGIISGYLGRKTDLVIQRIMDIIMAFPGLVLSMAIMAVMGASLFNVILAISIPSIPRSNRVARSVAISVKEFQYVEAARAIGGKTWHVMLNHILPNCMASFLIVATSSLSAAIIMEASLSFLGLGVPVEVPSWGKSLNDAMAYMRSAPWLSIFPGIAITLIVYSTNMLGDALRDVLDPRLKRL